MGNLDLVDYNESFGDDVSKNLKNLKEEISNNDNIHDEIFGMAKLAGINENIVTEYINLIKKTGGIYPFLDNHQKKELGFNGINEEITSTVGCILFYIRKLCPNKFEGILPSVYIILQCNSNTIAGDKFLRNFLGIIESCGDSINETFQFCSAFDGSYLKEGISHMHGKYFGETLDEMKQRHKNAENLIEMKQHGREFTSMIIQYIENFIREPESLNLFFFLKNNPQTLNNLGGKEIKSIDLSLNFGINFVFRGIIEMVKSRPDINFPNFKDNMSESEKIQWKQQREKIINEYENILRSYIARDKIDSGNKGKTFDKVFFTVSHKDNDEKIMPDRNWIHQFGNDVTDYSIEHTENAEKNNREVSLRMLSDIEEYAKGHPDEKILVCINHHGTPDGSSGNGWTREDWIKLANISPNIKIWSIRCYFGTAFDNKDIYEHKSSVSGFSNNTVTFSSVTEIISEASNKNLGFHEMEIYTRLNYPISVTPLTENMEYTNWNTLETETGKIGLAQNNEGQGDNNDNNYA